MVFMPTLLACLSTGKGTWSEVNKIIQSQPWDKIFLLTNQFGQDNFKASGDNIKLIVVDGFQDISLLKENIKKQMKDQIKDFEIALK